MGKESQVCPGTIRSLIDIVKRAQLNLEDKLGKARVDRGRKIKGNGRDR